MNRLSISALAFAGLFIFSPWAAATTGALTSSAGLTLNPSYDTGSREWVELKRAGPLLKGRPKRSTVKLLTLYAPGYNEGHLLLRELKTSSGAKTLLLTGPESLANRVRRVNVFMDSGTPHQAFLENVDGHWQKRLPQLIDVTNTHTRESGDSASLLAYSFKSLGLYRTEEDNPLHVVASRNNMPALGDVNSGLAVIGLAVVILVCGWSVSNWIHSKDQNDSH
jgi:hypothetical protein